MCIFRTSFFEPPPNLNFYRNTVQAINLNQSSSTRPTMMDLMNGSSPDNISLNKKSVDNSLSIEIFQVKYKNK